MRVVAAFVFGLLVTAAVCRAGTGADHVRVDLVADTTAVQPGKPFTLGVRFHIGPGWHIYWTNPGDSGLPTQVKLTLPAGFTTGDVQYPIPAVLKLPGGIINYGFEGEAVLLVTVTPPKQFAGGDVAITAKADYLVCSEVCLPGSATVSLSLPWSERATAARADEFREWQARLPQVPAQPGGDVVSINRAAEPNGASPAVYQQSMAVTWSPACRSGLTDVQWLPPAVPGLEFGDVTVQADAGGATVVRFKVTAEDAHKLPMDAALGLLEYTRPDGKRAGVLTPVSIGNVTGAVVRGAAAAK